MFNLISFKIFHHLIYSVIIFTGFFTSFISCNIHISVEHHQKVSIEYFYHENDNLVIETPKYIELKNGTDLILRCTSDRETKWVFNRKEYDHYSFIGTSVISVTDNKYITDLFLENIKYNQTGEYSCVYNDEKSLNEDFLRSSDRVYLFIYDNNHLVATKTLVEVPAKSEEYVLRCLPTNPRINVILTKDSEPMVIDNDTLKFHPTIGFIIKDSILDYKKSNLFTCIFKFENKTDEFLFPFTISYIPVDNLSIRINGDSENVIVNSTFTLTCELITQKVGQMNLTWSYPQNLIEPTGLNTFEYINDQMKYINTITFTNTTKQNEGVYSCSASNATLKNTKSLNIKVFDLNTTFTINITTDLGPDAEIEVDFGTDVQLAYTISVWPTKGDFKLNCLRNGILLANSIANNQMIQMQSSIPLDQTNPRYNFTYENNQLIISIREVDVSDSGIYTVSGSNSNSLSNESVTLYVNGLPSIKLNYNDGFFELNKLYNLKFEIISFPITNITFDRFLCSETDCNLSRSNWIDLLGHNFYENFNLTNSIEQIYIINNMDHNLTIKSHEKPKFFEIQLDLIANQSSVFKVEVENVYGATTHKLSELVSDAGPEGLDLVVENKELIENDNITLICKATKFNYTLLHWSSNENALDFEKLIETNETTHSLISKLTILNAKKNLSGDYRCNAEYKDDENVYEPNYKQINLKIEKMIPPQILRTNMETNLKVIGVYQTESIDLYCEVKGRPTPIVTWTKNNNPLNASSLLNGYELSQHNQHLIINRLVDSDSGRYECDISNKGGSLKRMLVLKVKNRSDSLPIAGIAGTLTFVLIGCVFVAMAVFLGKRIREDRKQKAELEMFSQKLFNINQNIPFNPDLPLDEQIDLLPYDNKWEFPIEKLTFGPVLGQGAFGRVLKAEAEGIDEFNYKTTVAVKMLKQDCDMEQRKALMAELKILIHLGKHLNIVNLLGAVTQNAIKGELLVILEYCEHGSLRQFLLNNRSNFVNQIDLETGEIDTNIIEKQEYNYANDEIIHSLHKSLQSDDDCYLELTDQTKTRSSLKRKDVEPITSTDLVCYAYQISRGMEYLESRKLIHRDLAIRNVLLAENNIVKICDFGLAKDCFQYDNYVKKNNGPLPVRWMAIESIADKVFTIKSDVWSFGVSLWEIFTLGSNPYPGMEVDEKFYNALKSGYRMAQPDNCPDNLYELMKQCWLEDPNERIEFSEITKILGRYLGENVTQHYIDLNIPYEETNQIMYLENEGYLQIDSNLVDQPNEEYLDIEMEERIEQTNYVNTQVNGYLNDEILAKEDKVKIIDQRQDMPAYVNV